MDRTFPDLNPALAARAEHLLARAFLYDDPASFRAGIMAMLEPAAALDAAAPVAVPAAAASA